MRSKWGGEGASDSFYWSKLEEMLDKLFSISPNYTLSPIKAIAKKSLAAH